MKFIADLHIHSLYSPATSKTSNIATLAAWARIKGVHVLGTGDFTHPMWFKQLLETLEPAEPGFFRLKETVNKAGEQKRYESAGEVVGCKKVRKQSVKDPITR